MCISWGDKMKCCKNCEYWMYEDIDKGHVCVNRASASCADWTESDDCCMEYEEKEKLTVSEIINMIRENMAEINRLIQKLEDV